MSRRQDLENAAVLFDGIFQGLRPPPKLTISQWADRYRNILSTPTAWPGRWQTRRVPYMREMMDAASDPEVTGVCAMLARQLAKTEGLILNTIGYHIHVDPTWMLVTQPTTDDIKEFSRIRINGLLEDVPEISKIMLEAKTRGKTSTVLFKEFRNGFLKLASTGSHRELVGRTVMLILMDEVDLYEMLPQGHPIDILRKMMSTFWNAKEVMMSTPTDEETSYIWAQYQKSSQAEWFIPCPACEHGQVLAWERFEFKTLTHVCESCGRDPAEHKWKAAQEHGEHRHKFPERRYKGFQVSAMASPWMKWKTLRDEFLEANDLAKQHDFSKLKVFRNHRMGQVWRGEGEKIDFQELYERREVFTAEVPDEVCLLVCAVDVGWDGVEWEVAGWGFNRERWAIDTALIEGDPHLDDVWVKLESEVLSRQFTRADGRKMRLSKMVVDCGFARRHVCQWTKAHQPIAGAIFGKGGPGLALIHNEAFTQEENARVWTLGSNALKDEMVPRLNVKEAGPSYWHYPMADEEGHPCRGYDLEFFKQLCNEKRILNFSKDGYSVYKWQKVAKRAHINEAFDLACYSLAALEIIGGKKAIDNAFVALNSKPSNVPSPFGVSRPDTGEKPKMPPLIHTQAPIKPQTPSQGMNNAFGKA